MTDYYRFLPLNTANAIVTDYYKCLPLNTASVIVTDYYYGFLPLNTTSGKHQSCIIVTDCYRFLPLNTANAIVAMFDVCMYIHPTTPLPHNTIQQEIQVIPC